jgi:hypothetical protein
MTGKLGAALLGMAILGSCSAETHRVSMRMDDDLQTSFAGAVVDESENGNILKGAEQVVEECGLQANVFRVDNGHRMNVSIKNVDPESLDGYLACVPLFTQRQFQLRPSYEDGWLFRYYRFAGSITMPRCYEQETRDASGKSTKPLSSSSAHELNHAFPRQVEVAMPGSIVSLDLHSDVAGGRYVGRRQGAVATIDWEPGQLRPAQSPRDRHCLSLPPRQRAAERDVLSVTISSRQAKFDLNTLLAIIGIIVSSGLVVEIVRRSLRPKAHA